DNKMALTMMATRPYSQQMPIFFIAELSPKTLSKQHSGENGPVEHLRFLAFFLATQTGHSPGPVSQCLGPTHRRDFPKCAYQAVDIIKVVADVDRDARAFASRRNNDLPSRQASHNIRGVAHFNNRDPGSLFALKRGGDVESFRFKLVM